MNYKDKLREYLKTEGISQKEMSVALGYAPAMISRYLNGVSVPDAEFIKKLVAAYPSVDLKYIFSESKNLRDSVNETEAKYTSRDQQVLEEIGNIEERLEKLKELMTQYCHTK